jgi:ABC-type sugar transport system ATPase subunit
MAKVELKNICKTFGPTAALTDTNIVINDAEFLVIVGPSGCGKSTLLRLVAGLEAPDKGAIYFDGVDVTAMPPKERGVAMVFQSYALYPHWTVFENIAFPLKIRRESKASIATRVNAIAESLQLTSQLQKRPKELSGGQRQRVALGRAIAADPNVILFDEPLSNLDTPLRADMRREIVARQKALAKTSLYVTHDQTEALTMADRIVVLNDGSVMGVGTPQSLYDNPPNRFVAQFLGRPPINLITATAQRGGVGAGFSAHGWSLPLVSDITELPRTMQVGIRPEHLRVTSAPPDSEWRVVAREFLGDKIHYTLTQSGDQLTALADAHTPFGVDTHVKVEPIPDRFLLFDPATGLRIPTRS